MHGRRRRTSWFQLKVFLINEQLFYLANLNDLCIHVTMVAMVQRPHATVGTIRRNHICNPQNHTVEFRCSIPSHVLTSSKTNTATISAMILYFVARKMGLLNQMQAIKWPMPSPSSSINAFPPPYGCFLQLRP